MNELFALTLVIAVSGVIRFFLARWLLDRCSRCGLPVEEPATHRCPPKRVPVAVDAGPVLPVPGTSPDDREDAPDVLF